MHKLEWVEGGWASEGEERASKRVWEGVQVVGGVKPIEDLFPSASAVGGGERVLAVCALVELAELHFDSGAASTSSGETVVFRRCV